MENIIPICETRELPRAVNIILPKHVNIISEYFSLEPNKNNKYLSLKPIKDKIIDFRSNLYDLEGIVEERRGNIRNFNRLIDNNPDSIDPWIGNYDEISEIMGDIRDEKKRRGYSDDFFEEEARKLRGLDNVDLLNSLKQFNDGTVIGDFGNRFMRRFVKDGVDVDEDLLESFELRLEMQSNGSHFGQKFEDKYFDTKYNFCLTYNEELVASLGFDIREGHMYVWQIQGTYGNSETLKPVKWERALLSYAVEWAEQNGIPEVRVISVDNNKWANKNGHLKKSQGKMLYDVTARRTRHNGNSFERDEESRDYVMVLTPSMEREEDLALVA